MGNESSTESQSDTNSSSDNKANTKSDTNSKSSDKSNSTNSESKTSDSKTEKEKSNSESRSAGYCYDSGYHAGKDSEKGNMASYRNGSGGASAASKVLCDSWGNGKDWNNGNNDARSGKSYGNNKK